MALGMAHGDFTMHDLYVGSIDTHTQESAEVCIYFNSFIVKLNGINAEKAICYLLLSNFTLSSGSYGEKQESMNY